MKPLQIIYKDEYLVAVNKPSGLLVHRSEIDKHETQFALQIVRDIMGQRVYPLHRLDKPTSGVLMFALTPDTANRMMQVFQTSRVKKSYLAVVRGYTFDNDTIDYPLKEELDKMTDSRADKDKPAQQAITNYHKIADIELPIAVGRYTNSRYSLVRADPLTGRKHQIRRHMKHIFHPIIGDTTHGDGKHNKMFRDLYHCHRLLLHAERVSFLHPFTEKPVTINAELDSTFQALVNEFQWAEKIN